MTIDVQTGLQIASTVGRLAGLFGGGGGPAQGTGHIVRGYVDSTGFHGEILGSSRNSEQAFTWPVDWPSAPGRMRTEVIPTYQALFGARTDVRIPVNLTGIPTAQGVWDGIRNVVRQAAMPASTEASMTAPSAGALTAALTNTTTPTAAPATSPTGSMMAGWGSNAGMLGLLALIAWMFMDDE